MVLGVTGGIATGKSSVAAMFADLGAIVVSADALARQSVAPGSAALKKLIDRFGREILDVDGALDRAALAQIVFNDSAARADLNWITHPAIARLAEERLAELRAAGTSMIVYEAPLLFEAGAESRVDKILIVTADPETQLARLVDRDGINHEEALARVEAQMPLAEKISRSDYLIDNSGPVDETREQVARLFEELSQFSSQ